MDYESMNALVLRLEKAATGEALFDVIAAASLLAARGISQNEPSLPERRRQLDIIIGFMRAEAGVDDEVEE